MEKIIESVEEFIRPKEGFACSDCPFSAWRSGDISGDEFLDCYCHKNHSYTYDSTNKSMRAENSLAATVIYKHIKICLDKENAVNEVLGGGLR